MKHRFEIMIKPLEDVLERLKSWPQQRQEEAVRLLEAMEQAGTTPYRMSPEERAAVDVGLAQSKRGELVSDEEMQRFWARSR